MPLAVNANQAIAIDSLKEAVHAAWSQQPTVKAALARRADFAARTSATTSMLKGAPALSLENWSDRLTSRAGLVKYAGEFSLPLWLPKERGATKATVATEAAQFEALLLASHLQTSGLTLDAYWAWHLAEVDATLAQNRANELQLLSTDTDRRLRAGFLSRFDAQLVLGQLQVAKVVVLQSKNIASNFKKELERIVGAEVAASLSDSRGVPSEAVIKAALSSHPMLGLAKAAVELAESNLALVQITNRDTPELGVGIFRERGALGSSLESIVTLRLRVPFASDNKNASRLSAARAEAEEARATLGLEQLKYSAAIAAAQVDLITAEQVVLLAVERRALSADNFQLVQKSFSLGEADLPSRLRAQNEFLDAEHALLRAKIEIAKSVSRLNHAVGLLP